MSPLPRSRSRTRSNGAGATAYAAGEYLAAIQALDAAYTLTPIPAIAFSLAQAERRQYFVAHEREHLDRAVLLFRRYVEQVSTGGRRADALDALSQLEPLAAATPSGPVTRNATEGDAVRRTRVMITSEAPGASISIDGAPPAPSPLIREVPPGKHHVEVTAEGFYPEERELTAMAGGSHPRGRAAARARRHAHHRRVRERRDLHRWCFHQPWR